MDPYTEAGRSFDTDLLVFRSLFALNANTNLPISTNYVLTTDGVGGANWQPGTGLTVSVLTSTVTGLGSTGYLSSVTNLVSTPFLNATLQSTVRGLGSAGYVSTTGSNLPAASQYGNYLFYNGSKWITGSTIVSIGEFAGAFNQGSSTIAIGVGAGYSNQSTNAIAIGTQAGYFNQDSNALAVGLLAGYSNQGSLALAIGTEAGYSNQGSLALAIGTGAGYSNQGSLAVAIGSYAGYFGQSTGSIAVGNEAAGYNQNSNAIAIGTLAGGNGQGISAIAIGISSGTNSQGYRGIAIGDAAGYSLQGNNAIAIGNYAGAEGQGNYAIAIGAMAGLNNQNPSSIILNASSANLEASDSGFYVQPIRNNDTLSNSFLQYDTITGEIVYNAVKTFVIDHPTSASKYLVHACLEGPEAGVYYRGKGEVADDGNALVNLPSYVDAFVTDLTVNVTPIYNGNLRTLNATEVCSNQFKVFGNPGPFHWHVYGKRQSITVEPEKSNVELKGSGPYRWLA